MTKVTSNTAQAANPFDQLIVDCQNNPTQIQNRYETHRSDRNKRFKAELLSLDFAGWEADEILRKLYVQATKASTDNNDTPFVDTRNNLSFVARPPQHIQELVAEIQQGIRDVAQTMWFAPSHFLHITTLEIAAARTPKEIEDIVATIKGSGVLPDLADYTFHKRTRLIKPIVSYDATAMGLSFVPAAGEGNTARMYVTGDNNYTYHHLRRDLFDQVTATGVELKPRYIAPSAHITIARFITQDGFLLDGSSKDGDHTVNHECVAALVEKIEQINEELREKYWPRQDGGMSSKGEWLVGQGEGLELQKGVSWYGGGEKVFVGRGFQ
ncbi:hypothetical protein EYZ11_008168 [Aspergillus tanneri]|uniref:RNA ligase/cyclic nucleotide phosphodiesterase n=1 Tax=Aspergillus tanneri TaxID=1220188 RepID=A0A4S3JBF4_9EURO|nr:hypothetical protein EYZ11_008168 [Aspergillus tanneri]